MKVVLLQLSTCLLFRVDGHFLNFDQASPAKATDFHALCSAIVRSMGKEPGNYAKVMDALVRKCKRERTGIVMV